MLPDQPCGNQSDTYTLSLSYSRWKRRKVVNLLELLAGQFALATRNTRGRWVYAVDTNASGKKSFRVGPWRKEYPLGTYGVDPIASTVWVVLDHDGEFAAMSL